MENLIVANWKMNPSSLEEAKNIFNGIKDGANGTTCEVVICPPFVYLAELKGLSLGAQNMYFEEKGSFDGEVSGIMLKNLGVEYVIIGHSERRKYFGETDETSNKKIKKALEDGLKVIYCIGETEEENNSGKRDDVLKSQIAVGLADISNFSENAKNITIAYEPVWAIGTGKNCSIKDAKSAIELIKSVVDNGVKVLYGGSVKSDNSGEYIKSAGANGLLVGGASLNAEEFVKIIKSAE